MSCHVMLCFYVLCSMLCYVSMFYVFYVIVKSLDVKLDDCKTKTRCFGAQFLVLRVLLR